MPVKKPTPPAETVRLKKPGPLFGAIRPKTTLIVAGCVLVGGILVAARQQATPVLRTTPRPEVEMMSDARPKAAASNASAAATRPVTPSRAKASPVTVTGCLERDGDGFRLKDTSGAEAPRSRSWKSGFLKKGNAAIDVVDAAHTLKLTEQTGRRVSVTGTLVDKEMRARSLRRVGSSCAGR
jgi:hypothetical protein